VVLAGACFWGVQAVFQHVAGVACAVSGYAGGNPAMANYDAVCTGASGHAEAVEVTFDPAQVSLGQLLHVFFSVAHDPTQLNRQGPDRGTQYRSAVFTTSDDQRRVASAYVAQLDEAKAFPTPIVTRIEPLDVFFPAEPYHQDYATLHPDNPYIAYNDLPKVVGLRQMFPELYRAQPALVMKRP
jgi:peptide-methionine (S)-S-oxide reductase